MLLQDVSYGNAVSADVLGIADRLHCLLTRPDVFRGIAHTTYGEVTMYDSDVRAIANSCAGNRCHFTAHGPACRLKPDFVVVLMQDSALRAKVPTQSRRARNIIRSCEKNV